MYSFVVGVYYWVRTFDNPEWQVCFCEEMPHFPQGVGFSIIGSEGTAYGVDNITEFVPIPRPTLINQKGSKNGK